MEFEQGDYAQIGSGERGRVIHVTGATVFVAFPRDGKSDAIGAFLATDLTKVDGPESDPSS